jgi:hypothetical protein
MRNLLRCRRGSVAFATVAALVPLIGVVALGAEAGSWYVIKQHAQNAADSAAMSGALAIANADPQPDFGTLNGFSSGDVATSQGTYSAGSGFQPLAAGGTPNAVQAVVTHCQPQTGFSLVLYTGSCNGTPKSIMVRALAVAGVITSTKHPCVLAQSGPVTFQDAAVEVNAPNCGIASNGTPVGINFSVAPKTLNVGSLTTAGGCSGSYCNSVSPPVNTYAPPTTNPFSALTNALTTPSLLTLTPCGATLTPYTASSQCANDNQTINDATAGLLTVSGVYFFSGGLTLGGNGSLTTAAGVSATIIVLPVFDNKGNQQTALKMAGGSTFNITAPTTAPSASALPGQLASVASLLSNMALFDPETSPQVTGGATMAGSGVFYLPNANPLNWQGSSTGQVSTCTEIIAASIQFSGTPNLNNAGCPPTILLQNQVVALVQ